MSYEFYRDFHSLEYAERFASFLREHDVPYKLEQSQTLLDKAIVGHGLVPPALIKIPTDKFRAVNEILRKAVLANQEFIDNHYLQQMDDHELIDMVRNPNEWTVEDVAVARKILNDRGIPIPAEHIEAFNKKKNEELRKGKSESKWKLALYSLFVVGGGAMMNPFFILGGVLMGWYYWQDKIVDNQGEKFYTFESSTRKAGKLIFFLSWLALPLGVVIKFSLFS